MRKCILDDGRPAAARIKTEDGGWSYVCILHLLQFKADSSDLEFKMMKGKPDPPITDANRPHDWERWYLVGMRGPWRCKICGLTVLGGLFAPASNGWGGCAGKRVDWSAFGLKDYDYRRESW